MSFTRNFVTAVVYRWTRPNGTSGITAYLKKMNIFLEDDDFEDRTYEEVYGNDEAPFDEE